jgi:hypothetical protein
MSHAIATPPVVIKLADYWMGRDERYPEALTAEIIANAARLVVQVGIFLEVAVREGVPIGLDEKTGTPIASGWRPPAVNDRTSNAAAKSAHITGEGIDLQDLVDQGRPLARFALICARPGGLLEELGLYMERPQWTDDWVHLQIRAPRSGRRVYVPSSASPRVAALPEEVEFVV